MKIHYSEIISSFIDRYGLSRGEVMAEIEKSFSDILSRWHGRETIVLFSDDQLTAFGYIKTDGKVTQVPVDLTTMRGWNSVKRILDTNLGRAAILKETATCKRKERQMRWGEIVRKQSNGGFHVEIEIEEGVPITSYCPNNYVGVHERGSLMAGQKRAFHIRRVEPVYLRQTPRLKVTVDRVSKTLVERLLQSKASGNVQIRCRNRYVGQKSFVESSAFLPREVILAASRELGEHIQVRVIKAT